jgi:hypothetical protein
MTTAERAPIDDYLATPGIPAALPPGLVEAANKALRGLQTVALDPAALVAALQAGGLPCTVEQVQERFTGYLQSVLRGHDRGTTRLTFAHEESPA